MVLRAKVLLGLKAINWVSYSYLILLIITVWPVKAKHRYV